MDPHAVYEIPAGHVVESRNVSKVRTTLRQFVRDWAAEGKAERAASYAPLVEGLLRHLPISPERRGAQKLRVLCPGCGLGRLPFDLARLGYAAQGNEFSYHMILGSHLMFNRTDRAECYMISPFALNFVNRGRCADNLRFVKIPDVCPVDAMPEDSDFSMAAGEFVQVYERQVGEWDGVATCFFLDTAKNVFLYIRTLASIVRGGGVWTNIGPLLYHYADVEEEFSIELSWEEVRPAVSKYFDIVEESRRECIYTATPGSLMRTKFRCVFFVAIRNSEPAAGRSNPVY